MRTRTFRAAAIAAAMLLLMTGCSPASPTVSEESTPTTTTTTTATTTVATTVPTQPKLEYNWLTGQTDLAEGSPTRAVALMVGNNDKSRPQAGLDQADLFVEAETEGGITRIMAVFTNAQRVPAKLGPIRSARTPFVLLAQSLDAIYCHAGGSSAALNTIAAIDISNIDALGDSQTFWRDATLRQTKGLEYSMLTGGDKLAARVKRAGARTTTKAPAPYVFGDKTGSRSANAVQVTFSGAQTISFRYSADEQVYEKYNGTLSGGSLHKTMEGTPLSAANILILYDEKYSENETTISFRLQSGSGTLVSRGTGRDIRWSRSSGRLSITETDGSAAQLAPGKTYICLVANSNAGRTVLQ